jgi:hypothetical protein
MPDNPVAYPKMVTCANPYQREAAQTPKRSTTASAAARKSFESIIVEHYARPIGWGRLVKHLKDEGHRFVRYAVVRHFGDFSIYTKSKAEARKIGNKVFLYLKDRLDLPINREKSGIRRPVDFEVLGHGFTPTYRKGEKGKYQLVVKKGSWLNLKRKLKQITKKTLPSGLEERLYKLKEVYRGWINNFRLGSIKLKLKKLDEWLRNRIRYCIWHDWKKLERKRKNLIRLGIEQGMAYAWNGPPLR